MSAREIIPSQWIEAGTEAGIDAWIDAWNAHDLPEIIAHYAPDATLISPVAAKVLGRADGRVCGVDEIGAYFTKALSLRPDLHFTLESVLWGVRAATILYRNQGGQLVAETVQFDDDGRIFNALVAYEPR